MADEAPPPDEGVPATPEQLDEPATAPDATPEYETQGGWMSRKEKEEKEKEQAQPLGWSAPSFHETREKDSEGREVISAARVVGGLGLETLHWVKHEEKKWVEWQATKANRWKAHRARLHLGDED